MLRFLPALCLVGTTLASQGIFNQNYTGDGTYYGQHGGAGHCSMQFTNSAQLPWTNGVSYFVALNRPQYNDSSPCGTCVALHGTGPGIGTLPVPETVAYAIVADECPECKTGDLDIATSGDGRWTIQWHAVPCDVGATSFQYSFQNSNPWYVKLGITNTRVPPASVELSIGGQYAMMQRTIDNYFVLSSATPVVFPATVRVTSIMGDMVEDTIGVATGGPVLGKVQFPDRQGLSGAPEIAPMTSPSEVAPPSASLQTTAPASAHAPIPGISPNTAPSTPVQSTIPSNTQHIGPSQEGVSTAETPVPRQPGACNRSVDVYQACGGGGDRCAETGQCYDGQWLGTCCPSGTVCTRLSEWYRQCLPNTVPSSALLPPLFPMGEVPSTLNSSARVPWSAELAGQSLGVTALLNTSCTVGLTNNQQCGGLGGVCSTMLRGCGDAPAEGVCCPSGNFCQRQNAYYYKCVANQTADASVPPGTIYIDQDAACGGLTIPDAYKEVLDGVTPLDGPWQNTRCRYASSVCMRLDAHYYECRALPFVTMAAADLAKEPTGPSTEGQHIGPLIDDAVARAAST